MAVSVILFAFFLAYVLGADPSHLVRDLPGQPQVGFKQYAGYIKVNATTDTNLFYWFFEADHQNQSSLPLVLWLNGGPGCSSVGAGALQELGPFIVNPTGTSLVLNEYAWNKAANVLFLESPYSVGFSYSKVANASTGVFGDEETAHDSLTFLIEWLKKFPEYTTNEFFMAGESYAGHYVPQLAAKILQHNKESNLTINLKGFAIGNGLTDNKLDFLGQVQNYYSHSLISDEMYNDILTNCFGPTIKDCQKAYDSARASMSELDHYNIYGPSCNTNKSLSYNSFQFSPLPSEFVATFKVTTASKINTASDPCADPTTPYLNTEEVKKALHANEAIVWRLCSGIEKYRSSGSSLLPLYRELLKTGIRIWIYSGDFDSVLPTPGTRHWIKALNLTIEVPWYAWKHKDQVGGWAQDYAGITFNTVRGAGHMVPKDQPGPALEMFKHFLAGKILPNF